MVIYTNKEKKMEELEEKQEPLRHVLDSEKMGTEESTPSRSTAPKSKPPLHNFTPPGGLGWGTHKFLRCMKVDATREISNNFDQSGAEKGGVSANHEKGSILAAETRNFGNRRGGVCGGGLEMDECSAYYLNHENGLKRRRGWGFKPPEKRSKVAEVEGDGIAAVREKVMLDLRREADKMKEAILMRGNCEEGALGSMAAPAEEDRLQPCNLRTRRAMNSPVGGGVGVGGVKNLKLDVIKPDVDALKTSTSKVAGVTTSRRRSGALASVNGCPNGDKKEREKFSVALGRREIEEDFMALLGQKPPRRPKKRAKDVQKQLDTLFPGLLLTEITADMYKVTETRKDKRAR